MARMLRLSMGLLAVSLLTLFGLHATTGQEATPTSPNFLTSGLTIDGLGSTPRMSIPADSKFYILFNRLTFEPGVKLELDFPGPIEFFVEEGELGVMMSGDRKLIFTAHSEYMGPGPIDYVGTGGGETILTRGYSVFSEDGRLGPTRNAGTGRLVVYAMMVVPVDGTKLEIIGDPNATPMNEIEIGS